MVNESLFKIPAIEKTKSPGNLMEDSRMSMNNLWSGGSSTPNTCLPVDRETPTATADPAARPRATPRALSRRRGRRRAPGPDRRPGVPLRNGWRLFSFCRGGRGRRHRRRRRVGDLDPIVSRVEGEVERHHLDRRVGASGRSVDIRGEGSTVLDVPDGDRRAWRDRPIVFLIPLPGGAFSPNY